MKHPFFILTTGLALMLCACVKNTYNCKCDTHQLTYFSNNSSPTENNFTQNYFYRSLDIKKSEQACYSQHAAETSTMAGTNQTVVATTTCSIK